MQDVECNNETDENGNPKGGTVRGVGLFVDWQNGPLVKDGERVKPNRAFVETLLEVVSQRIQYYQSLRFKCEENDGALEAIHDALSFLRNRTHRRTEEGTEGTHKGESAECVALADPNPVDVFTKCAPLWRTNSQAFTISSRLNRHVSRMTLTGLSSAASTTSRSSLRI